MNDTFIKTVVLRFARAFVSGAVTAAGLVTLNNVNTWSDLRLALNALAISAIFGGINGLIMALDKAYRFTE